MKNCFLFGLLALFWGGSFVAIKLVISVLPPLLSATLRVGLALVVLTAIYRRTQKSRAIAAAHFAKVWVTGIFSQCIPFALLFWGEARISPGMAGIINGTVPLWTTLFTLLLARNLESLNLKTVGGLLLGFIGIAVVYRPNIHLTTTAPDNLYLLAVLGMAISYGISAVLTKQILSSGVDLYANVYHQTAASFIALALMCGVSGQFYLGTAMGNWPAFFGVVYLGTCSTAFAWMMYYYLIREWGAIRASSVTYLVPPLALIMDFLFFANIPPLTSLVGGGLILVSVLLIHARFPKRRPTN